MAAKRDNCWGYLKEQKRAHLMAMKMDQKMVTKKANWMVLWKAPEKVPHLEHSMVPWKAG